MLTRIYRFETSGEIRFIRNRIREICRATWKLLLGFEGGWLYIRYTLPISQTFRKKFPPAPGWFSRDCISRNLSLNRVFNFIETKVRLRDFVGCIVGSLVAGRLVRWISSSFLEFLAGATMPTTTYLEDISRAVGGGGGGHNHASRPVESNSCRSNLHGTRNFSLALRIILVSPSLLFPLFRFDTFPSPPINK